MLYGYKKIYRFFTGVQGQQVSVSMAHVTGVLNLLSSVSDAVDTGVVDALLDVLLWDAFMHAQNGQLGDVTWPDVEAVESLRVCYGPLSKRICKQAAVVERVRGTSSWFPAIESAKRSLPEWQVLRQLERAPARLDPFAKFLQNTANLGSSTAFVRCFVSAAGRTDADTAVSKPLPSSTSYELSQRIADVGDKHGLTGNMHNGLQDLLARPASELLDVLRDMVDAAAEAARTR